MEMNISNPAPSGGIQEAIGIERECEGEWRMGSSYTERMIHFFNSGVGTDVSFLVGPDMTEVKAHKTILSIHSSVFQNLFAGEHVNAFVVEDCNPQEFILFLQYVYSGKKVSCIADAFPLIQMSLKYTVVDIQLQCTELLKEEIRDETALAIFEQSSKYGMDSLAVNALEYICSRGMFIMKSPVFSDLSKNNLIRILGRDDLRTAYELQIFEAFIRWGKAEMRRQKMPDTPKYLRSVLEDMVTLIRFPLMDKSDFSRIVAPMQILTSDELTAILLYFIVEEEDREDITPGLFNAKGRLSYIPTTESMEYVAKRFTHSPLTYATNLHPRFIQMITVVHSIRLRISAPMWITSIGVPKIFEERIYHECNWQFEIQDVKRKVPLVSDITLQPMDLCWGPDIIRFTFVNPMFIRHGRWYSISSKIIEGPQHAEFHKLVSDTDSIEFEVDTSGYEKLKFEFTENDSPTKQGFISTIGFKTQ